MSFQECTANLELVAQKCVETVAAILLCRERALLFEHSSGMFNLFNSLLIVDILGGNSKLVKLVPGLDVYGSNDQIHALTRPVKHGDKFKIGSLDVTALSTPCHTSGHICYFVKNDKGRRIYCLFHA